MLHYQHIRPTTAPKQWPRNKESTSAIFFPASCFLDPDLDVFQSTKNATTDQIKAKIGPLRDPKWLPGFAFLILNLIFLGLGFIKNLYHILPYANKARHLFPRFIHYLTWIYRIAALSHFCQRLYSPRHIFCGSGTLSTIRDGFSWIRATEIRRTLSTRSVSLYRCFRCWQYLWHT